MKHLLSHALTIFCLFVSLGSFAQGVTNVTRTPDPANPGNTVTVNIHGWLPNPCWSVTNSYISWCGNTVTIDLDFFNNGQICAPVVVDFDKSVNIGALPAGYYTLVIRNFDTGDYFYVNPFMVGTGKSCVTPSVSDLYTTSVTCSSATLNCTVLASSYQYRYRPVGAGAWQNANTPQCSSGNPLLIDNLLPNTQYEYQCYVCCNTGIDIVCTGWSPSQFFTTCSGGSNYTCGSPCPVFCGNTYTGNNGTLGVNNNNSWSGAGASFTQMYGPEVFYQITLNQAGPLNLTLSGLTADLDLILLSSCGSTSVIASSGNSNNTSEQINISNLPAGTYKIVVDGWNYAVSNYSLNILCGPCSCLSPYPVVCGNIYTGNNGTLGMNNNNSWSGAGASFTQMYGPEVFYQITLSQPGSLNLSLTGLSADLDLMLLSSCSNNSIIAFSGHSNATSESISVSNLAAGTYKIVIDGWNYAVSNYSLSVLCNCNCCPPPTVNQLIPTNITNNSARLTCNYPGASSFNWAYRLVGSGSWIQLGTTTLNYKDVWGLNPNCNYEFQCSVYCENGWTPWSPCQYFSTPCSCLSHDEPCGAILLTPASNCNQIYSTNVGATASIYPPAPSGCGASGMKDVWFKVQVPSTGTVVICTFPGTMTDGVVSFYKGSCTNLTPCTPSCFDATYGDEMPDVTINSQPGSWWYIRVWGYNGIAGSFSICAQGSPGMTNGDPAGFVISDNDIEDAPQTTESAQAERNSENASSAADLDVKVFPNPTFDQLNVTTQLLKDASVKISLLDQTGKLIKEQTIEAGAGDFNQVLDLNELSSGLYMIRLDTGETQKLSKFVKI